MKVYHLEQIATQAFLYFSISNGVKEHYWKKFTKIQALEQW